ncbi:zinc finger CCCH domain-containing protein 7A isoform X1 [Polypterus senegalus]|uniref:zinc finger CCCH domain-containing protein 7A isoform X1 n=1 Tax=Polypterus senegalus TaxID=55291 RepID=UPI0019630460|nr:zinc finger CCCH domain-containing protein 7A isoform X1 [Polypterus senegalus]
MSDVSKDRSSRWQEIQKGLKFIQSTLPYPGTQEEYEIFIKKLVKNLFSEANDAYKEGHWAVSLESYTEALSISDYAQSEDISISQDIVEKLHANRAACYLNMGLYDQVLQDCEMALELNDSNYRVLYRKARALKELGKDKEAYESVAKCSLAVPQDESVIKLTQELAKKMGLKIRKAYVRTQPVLNSLTGSQSLGTTNKCSNGSDSVEDIELELIDDSQERSFPVLTVASCSLVTAAAVSEFGSGHLPSVSPVESHMVERIAPAPPSCTNGGGMTYSTSESCLEYETDIIGDDLDELLDRAASDKNLTSVSPIAMSSSISPSLSCNLLTTSIPLPNQFGLPSVPLPSLYSVAAPGNARLSSLDTFNTCLDSLDSVSISEPSSGIPGGSVTHSKISFSPLNSTDGFLVAKGEIGIIGQNNAHSNGTEIGSRNLPSIISKNPLADTHEFKQACSVCYFKTGPKLLDNTFLSELDHKCKKDILLARMKFSEEKTWKKIRPRPTKTQYVGPYYICKDVASGEECRYPGHCTFAYCQEEIDVWTLERKGTFSRELLFDPLGANGRVTLTVAKILQEHHGIFMFLCEVCFDHKPRIISKRNKDFQSFCSHPITKHDFERNKCLVHILRETTVKYLKIRPYHALCQLDLCRHEVRYGCVREDECFYAHSLIEYKVWMMQMETGITFEAITQDSKKYWTSMDPSVHGVQQAPTIQGRFGPSNLKIQFVCAQCWRNGQVNEPDKNRKYCTAKARHPWSKERRVMLVMSNERKKWTTIRNLPTKKPIPLQFDLCIHIASGKKCQYIGNCTFAHSPEERDMWTFMKENNISDMEQLYELWLKSQKSEKGEESACFAVRENGKQIHMPTDYAEEMANYHCWLCGKNCNSEKQWQKHITSEKHKEKVFNSEDDQNCWQYRFPTGVFRICERHLKGICTEEENCKLAHGNEELKEWHDRKEFLAMKLAKARKDHLIAPDDNDFGKYSFLLKDIN